MPGHIQLGRPRQRLEVFQGGEDSSPVRTTPSTVRAAQCARRCISFSCENCQQRIPQVLDVLRQGRGRCRLPVTAGVSERALIDARRMARQVSRPRRELGKIPGCRT